MGLPNKVNYWLSKQMLPQRLLLSGSGDLWSLALTIATQLTGAQATRLEQGLIGDVKLCPDDGESLKIGAADNPDPHSVRGLTQWLSQKPVASHRVLVLQNFERTSRDALQAWLKMLEEPPACVQFIFTTRNHHQLPPTILSRMTTLNVSLPEDRLDCPAAEAFLAQAEVIKRFQIIEELDKGLKENPVLLEDFMHHLLWAGRHHRQWRSQLPAFFAAQQDLSRNVNRRLVLENLALKLQNE